ncbi:MAG: type IV pilus twitching motility protein PilT [Elusimicrobiota bacterium]|jgi:twitching motility protein PilT
MELKALLQTMLKKKASDLHLRSNKPAVFRVDGVLVAKTAEAISGDQIEQWVKSILNEHQLKTFEESMECDLALSVEEMGRFRVNVYRQRGVVNLAIRLVPKIVPSFSQLKLPAVIQKISDEPRGLVLVTGTTGSGKSTTLAAMLDYINMTRSRHIVTIEDPIEYVHEDKKSIVSQRELSQDTLSFAEALKHVLRQDPDIVLLGEMRDLETMSAALTAAQTGHLVLSTIHTIDTMQTVNRVIDIFPPHQQNQIRYQLGDTLRAVVSQRLLPHASGVGRVPAVEVMIVTPIIRKYILENTLSEIGPMMKQGGYYGMQTFHQSLVSLIQSQEITLETALEASSNPEEVMMAIRGVQTGTDNNSSFYVQP